ncbi:hypothetical protein GR217_34355 [Rhizobium leguminosarum]|uniref:Terminase small subunit n=1 Tax=Rhizobium ruizarguesonis TaxID=2081791 RepID=A0AAE4YZ28_9HYPH|nr:terminase small subunit [Rhizobium ruizarguesonis]NEI52703.1 hypothetical protein [Rhizobium ruizarguesonis]
MNKLSAAEIAKLCKRHPLPAGVDDVVMTREQLADAFQVTLNTVTAWIAKGMPMLQEGGQGKPYELQLSACWAWRQAQKADDATQSEKVRRAQAALRVALVGGTDDAIEALDPKTRREIMAVQIEQERFRQERNELMRRDDVREAFEVIFGILRDRMNAAPDVIERRQALAPEVVNHLIDICDEIVAGTRDAIERFWRDHPVRADVSRDSLDA